MLDLLHHHPRGKGGEDSIDGEGHYIPRARAATHGSGGEGSSAHAVHPPALPATTKSVGEPGTARLEGQTRMVILEKLTARMVPAARASSRPYPRVYIAVQPLLQDDIFDVREPRKFFSYSQQEAVNLISDGIVCSRQECSQHQVISRLQQASELRAVIESQVSEEIQLHLGVHGK